MTIYTDPFIIGLQQMPMPEVPEDAVFKWGGRETGWHHTEETRELLREKSRGNSSALGKNWFNPDSHKQATAARMLTNANPMKNPESLEKVRKAAFNKKPCPHCGQKMNAGNLSRHIKARHA